MRSSRHPKYEFNLIIRRLFNPNYLQHLKLCFAFEGGADAIPITLTMCDTYSTRRALMLELLFSFLAIQIVQTDVQFRLRILPEVEKDEQVNEEGSTLTLTCIEKYSTTEFGSMSWTLPRSKVIKMISINYSILNVVTRNRFSPSGKGDGTVSGTK